MSQLQKIVALSTTEADKNPADMLTKVVTIDKLKLCSSSVEFLKESRNIEK
ncbi:hypothetical protein ACJIZ3_010844 [Penstemon smallii]|uniref:Uncharacterized protein n=1 Tax=Penstemon smallii TaxID=265156 RepID=A0ABD3UL37_9LAMI